MLNFKYKNVINLNNEELVNGLIAYSLDIFNKHNFYVFFFQTDIQYSIEFHFYIKLTLH